MISGEPVRNEEIDEMEIELKVRFSEVKWLREAVFHHEKDIDQDHYPWASIGKDIAEGLDAAIDKMRPSE